MASKTSILLDFGTKRIALRKDNFQEVDFGLNGSVIGFKYNGVSYITTRNSLTRVFYKYLEKTRFWQMRNQYYNKSTGKYTGNINWDILPAFEENDINKKQLLLAEVGDTIEGCFEHFGPNGPCKQFYVIIYTGTPPDNNTFKQPIYLDTSRKPFDCQIFDMATQSGKFYDAYWNYPLYNNGVSVADPELISEISQLLQSLDTVVLESWNEFLGNDYQTTNFYKTYSPGPNPATTYTREQFISYLNGLRRWLQLLQERKEELKTIKQMEHGKLLMMLFTMNMEEMLRPLTAQMKIDALYALVADHALTSMYFSITQSMYFNKEALAMNIVRSVTDLQASDFLDLLAQTKVKETFYIGRGQSRVVETGTLYMVLFKAIDDYFGQNNFTDFILEINRLVLIKNNVNALINSYSSGFSASALQTLLANNTIKYFFFWKEKELKGKTTYDVELNSSNDTLTITENVCVSTRNVPHIDGDSYGPSSTWYTEECSNEVPTVYSNVPHFSLTYIYFYDNPSFLDLREQNSSYNGKSFFTFAGFFYYLQVKEETYWKEIIFESCLLVIFSISPINEIIYAIKGADYLLAFAGALSLAGNTAQYATSNTAFTNYLYNKYPSSYSDIITVLNIASVLSFATVGSQPPSSSPIRSLQADIFRKIPRTDAAKFLGLAREILNDEAALATLGFERNQFIAQVRKIESELYKYKSLPDVLEPLLIEQGKLKFYLHKQKLDLLTSNERIMFYRDFGVLHVDTSEWIRRYGSDFIDDWTTFTLAEKSEARLDPFKTLELFVAKARHATPYPLPGFTPISSLTGSFLANNFPEVPSALISSVNNKVAELRTGISPSKYLQVLVRAEDAPVSVSRMYDNSTGFYSEIYNNYTRLEIKTVYPDFENSGIHPNIRYRWEQAKTWASTWKANLTPDELKVLRRQMLLHAEVRALNDIAFKKFPSGFVNPAKFDKWIANDVYGYNYFLGQTKRISGVTTDIVHDPCPNCRLITDLVQFIRNPLP